MQATAFDHRRFKLLVKAEPIDPQVIERLILVLRPDPQVIERLILAQRPDHPVLKVLIRLKEAQLLEIGQMSADIWPITR